MKKIVMTAAVLACAVAITSAQTVTSANVVGYVKKDRPAGKLVILGNNFADSDLASIVGLDGKGFFVAGQADKVYVYNAPAGPYTTYFLYDNTVIKEWRNLAAPTTPTPSVPLSNAVGLFYESQLTATSTNNIAAGEVATQQYATNNIQIGLQLVCYPFSSDAVLNNTDLTVKGKGFFVAGQADKIYVYDPNKGGTGGYNTYFLYDNTVTKEWRDLAAPTVSPTPPLSIPQGQGFFYETSAIGGSAFQWVEESPYFSNL